MRDAKLYNRVTDGHPCGLTDSKFVIPEGVTEIGKWAFIGCSSIKSIEIPESVTEIGGSAFHDCSSLTLLVERDSYAAQYAKENDIGIENG